MALAAKNVAGLAYVEPMNKEEIRDEDTDDSYIEYISLEVTVSNGAWKSRTFKAKVNVGLSVPLLLGIPFMSAKNPILDIKANTAIDKHTRFNIVNPPPSLATPHAPVHTSNSTKTLCGTRQHEHPMDIHHEDYNASSQIMALIQQIETLSLEEELAQKDMEAKHVYADHFHNEPSKTTDKVPDHIYHCI
ncbi:hypothetical protein C0993_001927 [Termitomyces sp. T159_Od127]|nr:hypothetical protein C0993_001927 [Termitomyces sp. T159_Od127]